MSRCFPYPPPGYSRNGATYEALIESIKLQKKNDKAKAERKKEKKAKKEKKEKKEKRKDSTKSKLQAESQQDSHKQLQTSATIKKKQDPAIEQQLERSDLTEEHGQPVDSNKPSYSSDSTQNSNKRKRDDLVVPDDSNPVKPIKIRLLKKQKGPDSIKETSCSNSGRIDECTNGGINVLLVQRTPLVSSNRRTTTSHDRKQQPVPVPVSFPPKKNDVAALQSSKQQSIPTPIPIPIPSYRRPEPQIPTLPPSVVPSVSRNKNDATMVSGSGRKPIDEIKLPAVNNEKKKDPITLTKSEKKMMKKHSKYEKLIGGWVPPVLEPQVVPGDDDDWLKGSGKTTSGARSSRVDDVEMCREMMWQPCARFLVEADVYALPYTVPF